MVVMKRRYGMMTKRNKLSIYEIESDNYRFNQQDFLAEVDDALRQEVIDFCEENLERF